MPLCDVPRAAFRTAAADHAVADLVDGRNAAAADCRMTPVGRYAYSIDFSDGHDTGIYTLESLRELGHEIATA